MPSVRLSRDLLFSALGKSYTTEELKNKEVNEKAQKEFEDLCFRFGIELDDVTTDQEIRRKEFHRDEEDGEDAEVIYKIDIPANRCDLLCLEGLSQALRIFENKEELPKYKLADISNESMIKMHVKPETASIRPHVVCAVLRGITFCADIYYSLMDLQDKLEKTICRKKTLVAIGLHDLDCIQAPFSYEVKDFKPEEVLETVNRALFAMLNGGVMDLAIHPVRQWRDTWLHALKTKCYPVIYDDNGNVVSIYPFMESQSSRVTFLTKNVFIQCTGTDLTKAKTVLNTIVTAFSLYCKTKYEIEPVEVIYPDGESYVYPDLSVYNMDVSLSYINRTIGLSLGADKVIGLLKKMQLGAKLSASGNNQDNITVFVPPTRSDILHPCDVIEDVAIAYGYNNIPRIKPASLKPHALNEFSDLLRSEVAMKGYTEVMNFMLCSWRENFGMLNHQDGKPVVVGNPLSSDFEIVRTRLMPGVLKTVAHNKHRPKPIKIFELGDIMLLDNKNDVGATNRRQLAALHGGQSSGLQFIHWLVNKIMRMIGAVLVPIGDNTGYYLKHSKEPEFLPGVQASIYYIGKQIGTFGIVHPEVLKNFGIPFPCSFVEINIESFL